MSRHDKGFNRLIDESVDWNLQIYFKTTVIHVVLDAVSRMYFLKLEGFRNEIFMHREW